MTNVVPFGKKTGAEAGQDIKAIRNDYGITKTQAAVCLGVSAATIESWERGVYPAPPPADLKFRYRKYLKENGNFKGKNLLFGSYPLRMARHFLNDIPIADLANDYGYKKSSWLKFESNSRTLDAKIIALLEKRVQEHFAQVCATSDP